MSDKLIAVIQRLFFFANESKSPITPLALQKLLYFSWGVYWIDQKKYLFEDGFEAWTYGPVIPEVYHHFKSYGNQNIANEAIGTGEDVGCLLSLQEIEAIKTTWSKYGTKPTGTLVKEEQKEGSPWHQTSTNRESDISKECMETFFGAANLINQYRDVLIRLART